MHHFEAATGCPTGDCFRIFKVYLARTYVLPYNLESLAQVRNAEAHAAPTIVWGVQFGHVIFRSPLTVSPAHVAC